jgi:hypothetical protein
LPTGTDESERSYSDGKTTTALIQEWRFNQYCIRLQTLIAEKLDTEFKMFMRWRGINIDNSLFDLRFNEPQNFAKYRQAEVDTARINSFTTLEPISYLSRRFLLERYLDLSEEELQRNDELWAQENSSPEDTQSPESSLRNIGVTNAGLQQDLDTLTPVEPTAEIGGVPPQGQPETAGSAPETNANGGLGL